MKINLLSSIFFLFCISLFTYLGIWQLERAKEKENIISEFDSRKSISPIFIEDIKSSEKEFLNYRNVRLKGNFFEKFFLLDNRFHDKKVGFNVYVPFLIKNTKNVILVNLGWVDFDTNRKNISKRYENLLTQNNILNIKEIDGFLYLMEEPYHIGDMDINEFWPRLIQYIDFEQISDIFKNYNLIYDLTLVASSNVSNFKNNFKIVNMTHEKHLGYSAQWFGLAGIFLVIYLILFFRGRKQ